LDSPKEREGGKLRKERVAKGGDKDTANDANLKDLRKTKDESRLMVYVQVMSSDVNILSLALSFQLLSKIFEWSGMINSIRLPFQGLCEERQIVDVISLI